MFFLLRSTLCIGLVASALPDAASPDLAGSAGALAGLTALCRADLERCRHVAGTLVASEPALAGGTVRKLRGQAGTGRLPRTREVL